MIGYILLCQICILFWYISFSLSGYELLSPTSIIFLGFLISLILAIFGMLSWNTYPLSDDVLAIVLVGFLGVLSSSISFRIFRRPKRFIRDESAAALSTELAPIWRYAILFAIIGFSIMLRIIETRRLGMQLGITASNYSELSRELRYVTSTLYSTDSITAGIGYSFIEKQLEKIVYMTGYVASFICARGVAKSKKEDIALSFALLLSCGAFQLIAGGRGAIFYWMIALFVSFSFFLYKGQSSKRKVQLSMKIVAYGGLAAVLCAGFMYFAGELVGRKASATIIEYVSFYFGGAVPSLQIMSDLPTIDAGSKGLHYLVFYNVRLLMLKMGYIKTLPAYSVIWVSCGGFSSNIFTCFARYYLEYGLSGVYLLSAFSTMIMNAFYCFARNRYSPQSIVVASYICAFAFDCAREEFVFSRLFGTTQIINIVLLVLLSIFLLYPASLLKYRIPFTAPREWFRQAKPFMTTSKGNTGFGYRKQLFGK